MPLAAAYPLLEEAIKNAYLKLLDASQADGDNAEELMTELAKDLAAAIHEYTMSAVVSTVTSSTVVGTAAPVIPTGVALVWGNSAGTGTGNLL